MRFFIALAAISASFFGAYLYNRHLKISLSYNKFYFELAKALIHNSHNEMQSFETVFSEVYRNNIGDIFFDSTEKALDFAEKELICAHENDALVALFKKYLSCGQAEISGCESELVIACEKALEASEKQVHDSGKSAYLLYPGLTAIVLIILI